MDTKGQREKDASARLLKAAQRLDDALNERDRALRETARDLSRRRAGEMVGLSRGRVTQIINAPWTHRVRFVGYLDADAEKSLDAAGMEIRASHGGGIVAPGGELPQPNKHSVYLTAEDGEEARERIEAALRGHGPFYSFAVETVSPG